jgi:hypothetical protein
MRPWRGVKVFSKATENAKMGVTEQQGNARDRSKPGRYRSEHVRLPAGKDSAQAIMRGVVNERSGRGWRLVGATREPGDVVLLVWDTSGSFSSPQEVSAL